MPTTHHPPPLTTSHHPPSPTTNHQHTTNTPPTHHHYTTNTPPTHNQHSAEEKSELSTGRGFGFDLQILNRRPAAI
jgi:hypothetical protein